jgi:hypothetical protein
MPHHDEAMPCITSIFRLSLDDRRILREYSRQKGITMSDAVRMGIRKVCGGVDKKPEQPSAA